MARCADQDSPAIRGIVLTSNQPSQTKPVDQLDRTMGPDVQTLGEMADGWHIVRGNTFEGQEELMLLLAQTLVAGRIFAEMDEAADLVAEFSQFLVIRRVEIIVCRHAAIISYYD